MQKNKLYELYEVHKLYEMTNKIAQTTTLLSFGHP